MRTRLESAIRDESGKVFILVLALLVVGGLILGPVLGLMGTGLSAGQVYEKKTHELYAADAGVEDALWRMQNPGEAGILLGCGNLSLPHDYEIADVNGRSVNVTIVYLGYEDKGTFKITSIATCPETGSSTTVVSYVQADYEGGIPYDEKYADGSSVGSISGNLTHYGEGDLTVTGSIGGEAVVYVEGTLTVDGNIEEFAEVYVGGDLILTGTVQRGPNTTGNIEGDVIICVARNVIINGNIEEDVQMYILGDLTLTNEGEDSENRGKIEDRAQVCVEKEITLIETQDDCTVCAGLGIWAVGGTDGYIYAQGYDHDFPDCPMCCWNDPDPQRECLTGTCCECPFPFQAAPGGGGGNGGGGGGGAGNGRSSWGPFEVASYTINP